MVLFAVGVFLILDTVVSTFRIGELVAGLVLVGVIPLDVLAERRREQGGACRRGNGGDSG